MESRSETSDRARALSVFRRQPHNHPSGSRQSCLCRSIGKKTGLRYIRYPSHNSQKPLKFSTKQYCLPVHLFSIPAKRYGALLQKSSSDQYRPHYHAAQTETSCQRRGPFSFAVHHSAYGHAPTDNRI